MTCTITAIFRHATPGAGRFYKPPNAVQAGGTRRRDKNADRKAGHTLGQPCYFVVHAFRETSWSAPGNALACSLGHKALTTPTHHNPKYPLGNAPNGASAAAPLSRRRGRFAPPTTVSNNKNIIRAAKHSQGASPLAALPCGAAVPLGKPRETPFLQTQGVVGFLQTHLLLFGCNGVAFGPAAWMLHGNCPRKEKAGLCDPNVRLADRTRCCSSHAQPAMAQDGGSNSVVAK